jgi:hypothetical protein
VSDLVLNSFPVEIAPTSLALPYLEYANWEESTEARKSRFSEFSSYRFELTAPPNVEPAVGGRIRLVLLSGPARPEDAGQAEFDLGAAPNLGANLIEQSLALHLESRGMLLQRNSFERVALMPVDSVSVRPINLYSGISFRARRPFSSQPCAFALSVQWVARAVFADTLVNPHLRDICRGLAVLYTPETKAATDLRDFEHHFLGHVKDLDGERAAIVGCRDYAQRSISLADLTLEASPEAIRRYEMRTGSQQARSGIWRTLQQLSKVLTKEGRRNPQALRQRLEAIRGVLGGNAKERVVLSLNGYANGTVTIGLNPLRVEVPA